MATRTPRFTDGPWQSLRTHAPAPTAVGLLIRDRRLDMGISQSKLAERLGLDHSYLSRIESGTRVIHQDQIPVFASVMDLDPHDLALAIAGLDAEAFRESLTAPLERVIGEFEAVIVGFRREAAQGHTATRDDDEQEAA